jgi:LAGLIDADG endonuclease
MGSDNVTSGDNQQETEGTTLELDPQWVVGFVDGEGCFSVSVHRNPHVRRTAWQLQASFQVYQHEASRAVLEAIVQFFGCGRIRPKGPKSRVLTYSVWNLGDLEERVLPVFERHPLQVKGGDFQKFAEIVRSQRRKEHLDQDGFERIARLAYSMNANGKQRARTIDEVLGGSSETIRQASLGPRDER